MDGSAAPQPDLVTPSPPAVAEARPKALRALSARKGALAAWLVGFVALVGAVLTPWFESSIIVWLFFKNGVRLPGDQEISVQVWDISPWGPAYLAAAVLLAALGLAAHVTTGITVRRGLAVGALLAGVVAAGCLFGASAKLERGSDATVARWADLVQRLLPDPSEDRGSLALDLSWNGLITAVLATTLLTVLAAGALWPGKGGWVALGSVLPVVAAAMSSPAVEIHAVMRTARHEWLGFWPAIAPSTGVPALIGLTAAAALILFALVRSSTAGRLPLLLVTLVLSVGAAYSAGSFSLDPVKWVPAADRQGMIDYTIDSGAPQLLLLLGVGSLLCTAAVLAWLGARRRARAAATAL